MTELHPEGVEDTIRKTVRQLLILSKHLLVDRTGARWALRKVSHSNVEDRQLDLHRNSGAVFPTLFSVVGHVV